MNYLADYVRDRAVDQLRDNFFDLAHHEAQFGAELLVNQSFTSTIQRTWVQQLAVLPALYAAEVGRSAVHVRLSGDNLAFDVWGR